jgi:hypothetical protein
MCPTCGYWTTQGANVKRLGWAGLATVAIAVLYGVFLPLAALGSASGEAAVISLCASAGAFWVLAGRFVGPTPAGSDSWRSLPRFVLSALSVVVLGLGVIVGGTDLMWRLALVLAPAGIVASAYLLGRGAHAAA